MRLFHQAKFKLKIVSSYPKLEEVLHSMKIMKIKSKSINKIKLSLLRKIMVQNGLLGKSTSIKISREKYNRI